MVHVSYIYNAFRGIQLVDGEWEIDSSSTLGDGG